MKFILSLLASTFLAACASVPMGDTSQSENNESLVVNLKPGTLTYVWQEIKMGLLSARSKLSLVSEVEGKKGVLATKLAQTQ